MVMPAMTDSQLPPGYSTRLLAAEDEPLVWQMLQAAIYPPDPQWTESSIRAVPQLAGYADQWGRLPGDFGLALMHHTEPVGACWARFHPADHPGYGYVAPDVPDLSIALLPGVRGMGLGTRLMQALLDLAYPRCRAVSLNVQRANPAVRLYQRLGFVNVDSTDEWLTMWREFSTDYHYSLMTPADYPDAAALWQGMPGIGLSDADSPEAIACFLDRNPGISYVVRQGGALVATLLTGHDSRRGYLYHLAVHPDVRRQGIGQRLVQLALAGLARSGIHKAHLFVYGENQSGIAFWTAAGWKPRVELVIMSADTPRD
jgi:ribosomal protein S18 acetylase RimI-like enzyme